ncbi:hypothetical protein PLICRDRAFT_238875 [Plicaturopsis crispa FD-325 SS-3]|nr:hypothetical protein PLICRDRAFT_238875 [Plicaturopsis crispa FD-325 SS-3]
MQERQRELLSLGSSEWKWESFKTEFISFYGILLRELESWEQPPVFSGSLDEDPNAWLDAISKGCQERQIPEVRHADVAIYFLAGDIKDTMMAIKTTGVQTGSADWSWALFVEEFKRVYQHVRQSALTEFSQRLLTGVTDLLVQRHYGTYSSRGKMHRRLASATSYKATDRGSKLWNKAAATARFLTTYLRTWHSTF